NRPPPVEWQAISATMLFESCGNPDVETRHAASHCIRYKACRGGVKIKKSRPLRGILEIVERRENKMRLYRDKRLFENLLIKTLRPFAIAALLVPNLIAQVTARSSNKQGPAPQPAIAISDPAQITSKQKFDVQPFTIEKLYLTREIGDSAWSP